MSPARNHLYCSQCGSRYSLEEIRWRCRCGSYLDIHIDYHFNIEKISSRNASLWRYREAIPVIHDKNIISLGEGLTPLTPITFINKTIFFKQDHLFPSGSFKDRGATVLISKVSELGIKKVVEDSSGNAGAAIAAYCARAGISCHIFIPLKTSQSKADQIIRYGARVTRVSGTRENASKFALEEARNAYFASHTWNPFFIQGTKTFSFEVCEQLGWSTPDTVVLPVGNGTLLLGAHKGFQELQQKGIITKIPRLIAIQPENCAPIYHTFKKKRQILVPIKAKKTLADGLAISRPLRWHQIIKAIQESEGDVVAVTEDEIQKSLDEMLRMGFYIESSSAVTIAGIKKILRQISSRDLVVSAFTGHGLKGIKKKIKPADRSFRFRYQDGKRGAHPHLSGYRYHSIATFDHLLNC